MTVVRFGIEHEKKSVASLRTYQIAFACVWPNTLNQRVAYLEHTAELFNNRPLIIGQLKLPQPQLTLLCEQIDCLAMLQGILQQVDGRVPLGRNVSGHQTDREAKIVQDVFPCREDNGCRVDDLEGNLMELRRWLDSEVCRDLIT